jgi:uncharacterized protein YgiM (DUF1202 family)
MKLLPCFLSALLALSAETALTQPPSTNANAAESAKSGDAGKKPRKFAEERLLDPPATATVKDNLNVRGQPALIGEVVGLLHKGDTVTVLETMTLRKPRKDEPAKWARIALPTNTPVWVFAEYVDSKSMTITRKRVNFRGGPGENYSVLGRLQKGDTVEEIRRKNGWIQIKTPATAYAFVDADYLDIAEPQPSPAPVVAETKPAPPPETAPAPAPAPAPVAQSAAAPATPPPSALAPTPPPAIPAPEPAPATPSPAPERVVTREGILRRTYSLQAPTDYELRDLTKDEMIDFIEPRPKENLKKFVGLRVTVTGPEVLDPRWTKTPILELQKLEPVP